MREFRLHGPPGVGKTRALATSWVPKAAERFGSERVVICSLTKTAAAEIASRDVPIPKANVGTLHSLCYRALGVKEIAETHTDLWNEEHPEFELSSGKNNMDDPLDQKRGGRTDADVLMEKSQVYRHRMIPPDERDDAVRAFEKLWSKWKGEHDYIDFTDMIEFALRDVDEAPNDPACIIVDEAQDSSILELSLIRKWTARAEYAVLAGDSDQAIYGWRGADATAMVATEIPEEDNYKLTKSWRVPAPVHAAASAWIDQADFRYKVNYTPREGDDGWMERSPLRYSNGAGIVERARELERDGSVMILASCGYMLHAIIRALKDEGLLFHNPYRRTQGAWNPLRGGVDRLRAFLNADPRVMGEEARAWDWVQLGKWAEHCLARGVFESGAKKTIKENAKLQQGAERRTRIDGSRMSELMTEQAYTEMSAAYRKSTTAAIDWLDSKLSAKGQKLFEYAFNVVRKRGGKALLAQPKIIVGTVHSVKGGEADSVLLSPDLSPAGSQQWLHYGEPRDSILRVFYVGMTRARRGLVLCEPSSYGGVQWL